MANNNTTYAFCNTTDSETDSTSVGIMYLVTSLSVVVSNCIVVVVVVTSRELHLPTLWNIAFMALCDCCYGLHYLVFAVPSAFMNRFAYPEAFIASCSFSMTLILGQNFLNIAVATVDRYLSVCWPLRYPQLMTGKRFIIATIITVFINLSRLCLIYIPNGDVCYDPKFALTVPKFNTLISAGASVGFPFVTVIVTIGFLLRLLWEIARARRRVHPATIYPLARQFTVTVGLSAGVCCLCYIPGSICVIWILKAGFGSLPMELSKFAVLLLLSNSFWNVIIYAATYQPFRNGFLRLFCADYHRKKRQLEMQVIFRNDASDRNNR